MKHLPQPEEARSMDGNYTEDTRTEPDIEMDPPPEPIHRTTIPDNERYCYDCCEYICRCTKGEPEMEPDVVMEHRSECYEPTYDERPTITFKEVWGKHAWKVEYYGKYDNKREPHVKLRFDYDAPDQHIYKVRQGDVYSLHNLRKGGKDNQAVLWDVQGLILSNGKEAHFTVHHGQRHEKEFMSTRKECLQTKVEELKKRLTNSGISKTAREKAAKEKQKRPRKKAG